MSKLNCNIISDLLPSYLDNICTKDTKDAVDSHLAQCSQCRNRAQMMRDTDFVSVKAECREIDYMKKIKRNLDNKKTAACLLLAAAALSAAAWLVLDGYRFQQAWIYGILPAVLTAVTGMILSDENKKMGRTQKIMTALSLIVTGYGILLAIFASISLTPGSALQKSMFFLELQQVGPFCYYQFVAIILLQIVLYLYGLYSAGRKNHVSLLQMGICMTGEYMMLAQVHWQRALDSDSAAALSHLLVFVAVPLLGGAAGTLSALFFGRERRTNS